MTTTAPCRLTAAQSYALGVLRKAWPSRLSVRDAGLGTVTVASLERAGLVEQLANGWARALPWCRACGCTERHACRGGCAWILPPKHQEAGLCSGCET